MPHIVASWICRNCKHTHRVHYQIITNQTAISKATDAYESEGVKIVDPMHTLNIRGSVIKSTKGVNYGVYTSSMTAVSTVIRVLKEYLKKNYTIEEITLTAEICYDE